MSDTNTSKSRFPPSRPWTASGSRSPFTAVEVKEDIRQKQKSTVERSLGGGRRQRRAAARHVPSDDQSSLNEGDVEEEEKTKGRPKKSKRLPSPQKYSVSQPKSANQHQMDEAETVSFLHFFCHFED